MSPVDKLILGTVQLGLDYGINNAVGKPKQEDALRILEKAHDSGITRLDTAEAYGNSQDIIGLFHQRVRKRFDVITKFSAKSFTRGENFSEHVKGSIKRLNVDALDAYLFHSYSDFELFRDSLDSLKELKAKKLIKKIGVSVYTNAEAMSLLETSGDVDLIQMPFNLLDNNNQRGKILERAHSMAVEIHVRSIFLQGLFMKERQKINPPLNNLRPYLEVLDKLSRQSNKPLEAIAISYALQNELIGGVLFGVDTLDQLEKNITLAKEYQLSPEEIGKVNHINVKEIDLLNPVNWNK